ncbi:MAG TPA: DUF421 domain-containing protein [Candidatus Onthousia excrementipullorum]|uniref:DUF421 domain-containing protein n=1 Tax=Candidatus Onthousia excrementipullorum TaxID=2840884 RepID=A0A9D1DV14_9FIRM|nr:DUF421 domain-containing protein [Candidatus Onthousia excrementipullorum]
MDYLLILLKTLFFYFAIVIFYRFMGKREVGELGIIDLIVSVLIAELAAISIERYDSSVFLMLLPIGVLVILQIVLAKISLKSDKVRSMLDGDASVIIDNGKVNFKEMIKQRYNLEDLLTQLRARNVKSIEEVEYAILETSGKLSVFTKDANNSGPYPLPLILDGKIQKMTLKKIRRKEKWLNELLASKKVKLDDVFYAFYKDNQLFIIKNSDCIS